MPASLHALPAGSSPRHFQPLSLVTLFLTLLGRRRSKQRPAPNPDWEQDEPMTGLS